MARRETGSVRPSAQSRLRPPRAHRGERHSGARAARNISAGERLVRSLPPSRPGQKSTTYLHSVGCIKTRSGRPSDGSWRAVTSRGCRAVWRPAPSWLRCGPGVSASHTASGGVRGGTCGQRCCPAVEVRRRCKALTRCSARPGIVQPTLCCPAAPHLLRSGPDSQNHLNADLLALKRTRRLGGKTESEGVTRPQDKRQAR